MENQAYKLIINSFSVGTWQQTLIFYFFLFVLLRIILMQLSVRHTHGRGNFIQRWMEGRLQK
ncbi:hypothetical protein ACPPVU_09025 [Mucilaginibacter sp. McL0603]|uniref:hypothetical protein n=1 Tax=Mucilaginibacter sp. McL0603 TaxID=3415670 RepID=UPI003CEC1997